jgi:large subunit ribosomal protein L4
MLGVIGQGSITQPKTRVVVEALQRWGVVPGSHALLIVDKITDPMIMSCRNIPTLRLTTAGRLSVNDILRADNIIIEAEALKYIQVRSAGAQAIAMLLSGPPASTRMTLF